jgi:hypothetical protein
LYETDFIQGLLKKNEKKHTPYAGAVGMLLHINGKFTMGK